MKTELEYIFSEPKPAPGSMWLVIYECRWSVVVVSPKGDGFFAPGQDPCWPLDHAKWVREIKPTTEEEANY